MWDYIVVLSLGIIHIIYIAIYYGVFGNKEFFGLLYIIMIFMAFPVFLLYARKLLNKIINKFKALGEIEGLERDV